jgi:gas vesicle protein
MATENNSEHTSPKKSSERVETKAEQLREDIARTRSALSEDVKALSERLQPGQLKEDAKEVIHHATDAAREGARQIVRETKDAAFDSLRNAKEHAFESISEGVQRVGERARLASHTLTDFVATHALPLALLGAGTGWLLINMSHQRRAQTRFLSDGRRRYGGYEEGIWEQARDRAGELSQRAASALSRTGQRIVEQGHELQEDLGERAAELRTQVADGASYVGHEAAELGRQAYRGIERAGSRAIEVSERSPLTIGLFALAAGAVVAMLLPPTRRENQLLGQTRDRLVEGAQRSANELKSSVQRSVDDVREVIEEVRHPGASHA